MNQAKLQTQESIFRSIPELEQNNCSTFARLGRLEERGENGSLDFGSHTDRQPLDLERPNGYLWKSLVAFGRLGHHKVRLGLQRLLDACHMENQCLPDRVDILLVLYQDIKIVRST